MDDEVTPREILDVAKKDNVQSNWEDLAAELDPDKFTMAKIKIMKTEILKPSGRTRKMLEDWHNNLASQATRRKLINALCECGCRADAERVFGRASVESVNPADHPDIGKRSESGTYAQ